MSIQFTDLQCKEVICIGSGQRLGFITDVQIDIPEGSLCAIVVPGPCRILGIAGRSEDYLIPWSAVRKIGPDIVLVDIRHDECRVPRRKGFLPV
mgnify:CR=1 FL=1